MSHFTDRRALVTGAGSGIGREVALGLARDGAKLVYLFDRDGQATEAVAGEVRALGCAAGVLAADVAVETSWLAAADLCRDQGLDILVHAAGIAHVKPVEQTSLADWRHVVDVNLSSLFLAARHLFPLLTAGGSVVAVASVAALVGQSHTPAYIASKGGMVALTRGLAVDYAARGIRVNVVCPGPTATPLLERHFALLPDGDAARRHLEGRIPLAKLLTPADVAPTILFLAGPGARMITGATFVVDGGLSATFDYGGGLVQAGDRHA